MNTPLRGARVYILTHALRIVPDVDAAAARSDNMPADRYQYAAARYMQ